jgi:hypothetical protein
MLNIFKAAVFLQTVPHLNVISEQSRSEKVQWQVREDLDLARQHKKEEAKEVKQTAKKGGESKKKNKKDDDDNNGGGLLEPII